jgi:hypothetical protein
VISHDEKRHEDDGDEENDGLEVGEEQGEVVASAIAKHQLHNTKEC